MASPQSTEDGSSESTCHPELTSAQEEWIVGLTLSQAEALLDQLECQGCNVLALSFDEKTGFAVRCS